MKIKVNEVVLDYENKPISDKGKDLTWRNVIFEALNSMIPNEVQTADDKNKSYQITLKCYQSSEPDLTLDDRNFIVNQVKKIYNPLVCGRAQEYFDKPEPVVPIQPQ